MTNQKELTRPINVAPAEQPEAVEDGPLATAAETTAINLRRKVEYLKKVSNVIQALENVMAQSEGIPDFQSLRTNASMELLAARKLLIRILHT